MDQESQKMRALISIYEIVGIIMAAGGLGTFWLWIRERSKK